MASWRSSPFRALGDLAAGGSGPAVARLFHALLALVFLDAWISLGRQIDVLAGSRGLLPAASYVEALRSQDAPFGAAPSIFRFGASDGALHAGIAAGVVLALLAFVGCAPRLAFALQTALYLSFAVVLRTFLSFQWDNLLLECGMLAVFLPRDREGRWAHALLRVLLFKLYFESGIAKWQSPLHDWHDGSAMTFYYETAPLPTRLAWYAHALPPSWHAFEGWFTLVFELAVPFAIFGRRRARLAAAAIFTGFQLVNVATANYGFFSYLALALHVFLLDEADVVALRARLRWRGFPDFGASRLRRFVEEHGVRARLRAPVSRVLAVLAVAAYLGLSLVSGVIHFASAPALVTPLRPVYEAAEPYRLVNAYHLFAAITRERIEPEIQTSDGATWAAHDLRYKPGDVARAPAFVAPHQPRVDFQMWFYGLSFRRGTPPWIAELLRRVCDDPAAVQDLFAGPLPEAPRSARMAFYRYHFTTPAERRATGAWWTREPLGATRALDCATR